MGRGVASARIGKALTRHYKAASVLHSALILLLFPQSTLTHNLVKLWHCVWLCTHINVPQYIPLHLKNYFFPFSTHSAMNMSMYSVSPWSPKLLCRWKLFLFYSFDFFVHEQRYSYKFYVKFKLIFIQNAIAATQAT